MTEAGEGLLDQDHVADPDGNLVVLAEPRAT